MSNQLQKTAQHLYRKTYGYTSISEDDYVELYENAIEDGRINNLMTETEIKNKMDEEVLAFNGYLDPVIKNYALEGNIDALKNIFQKK